MEPIDFLRSLGGVARTRTLLEAGYSERAIGRLAAQVQRPRKGLIAIPGCNPDYLFALRENGLLSCGSAAAEHGLWIRQPPARRHLGCLHSRNSLFVPHRTLRFPPHPTLPIASVEDTVLHALGCLPLHDAVAMAESAARRRLLDVGMLEDLLVGATHSRARNALALVIRDRALQAHSQPEIEARLLFAAQGWHVETQVDFPGGGHADFRIERRIPVEIDGFEYHGDRHAFVNDRDGVNRALLAGQPTLRYPPEAVWHDKDRIIREISRLLEIWPEILP
jgi:very-short-patch-repair endonuclease